MRKSPIVLALALAGCQTTLDPNYALQLESYRLTLTSNQAVEVARANAEAARYAALAEIAAKGGPQSQQLAILAIALSGKAGGESPVRAVVLPNIPESQEDRALKWAAIFAGPLTSVAQGYFGYRLGVTQSNNTANSTIASYNALGLTAVAGFNSNQSIAGAGFNTVDRVVGSSFGAFNSLATGAFASNTRPNVILNGTGVIGSGSYVGPNSGENSGNTGRINSPNTNRDCSSGATTTSTAGQC